MRTRGLLSWAVMLGLTGGCGARQVAEPKVTWDEVSRPAAGPARFDPHEFASRGLRPAACEAEARQLAAQSKDHGWSALRICVKHKDFTLLKELASEPWIAELNSRPDAMSLLVRVIANRGGSIRRDVAILHEHKVPLFAFGAAMAQPDTYKGQYVLLRAKVSDIRNGAETTTVKLAEYDLGSAGFEHDIGPTHKSSSSYAGGGTHEHSAAGSASYQTSNYGSGTAEGAYSSASKSSYGGGSEHSYKTVETKYDNVASETGRAALGKLAKPDPFLTPDKEFIVLGRFEGTRSAGDGDKKQNVGVLTVVSYLEPSSLVVY